MRLFAFFFLSFFTVGCLGLNSTQAQDDFVERAKTYPPRSTSVGASNLALASIGWKLELKQELMGRYLRRKEQISQYAEANLVHLEDLVNQQPPEVRFLDKAVRSRLIGKIMEELLDARLELATGESSVALLKEMLAEGKQSKQAVLIKRQSEMAIEAARLKVGVAEAEYQKTKQLTERGSKSNRDYMMAQYTLGIAKIELESAVLRCEVESEQQNSEIAQRLTDARIEIEPVRSRIAAAEKYLKQFVDSASLSAKIEEMQRKIETRRQDIRVLSGETLRLSQEIEELSVLKSRIERDLKKMEADKDAEKKDAEKKDKDH
jgi:hypothetical protein